MNDTNDDRLAGLRTRREPPRFREVTVVERRELSLRMLHLTFQGPALHDMPPPDPAASIRLLTPSPGTHELVIPTWNGNEFLLANGDRPALRTFTPLNFDPSAGRLELQIVRHPGGVISSWAETVEGGAPAAISGPGRGYRIDDEVRHLVILGDETAVPAISQLLETLPAPVTADVHIEVVADHARLPLPTGEGRDVTWYTAEPADPPGARLVAVAAALTDIEPSTRFWAAGEAASMQAIRTQLFDEHGVPRRSATVRGYWKPARSGGDG